MEDGRIPAGFLPWFEGLCASLATGSKEATPALLKFRNTEGAHELCCFVISNNTKSDVKFQALLILKYTTIKKWKSWNLSAVYEFQEFLWNILSSQGISMETFLLNKLIQVQLKNSN